MRKHPTQVAVLHGAGYVGGELIRLLVTHPHAALRAVTSRTFAGEPVWKAHPALRGQTDLVFSDEERIDLDSVDVLLLAAEHGRSAHIIPSLIEAGFGGKIVDMSADFRVSDPAYYESWFDYTHPAPELLGDFSYGLPECRAPYPSDTSYIANPGCFATGIALALWPLAQHVPHLDASVTALTGASGSGVNPKSATHFPARDGNVTAYKVMAHQHIPEVQNVVGSHVDITLAPASGPWTRGIWGTIHAALPPPFRATDVGEWMASAYRSAPLVRCFPGALPELLPVVNTPFCDIGWVVQSDRLVIGFALDNLIKGAAGQAIQNMNLLLGLPETTGLLAGRLKSIPQHIT